MHNRLQHEPILFYLQVELIARPPSQVPAATTLIANSLTTIDQHASHHYLLPSYLVRTIVSQKRPFVKS
jgi:hypothetical protein